MTQPSSKGRSTRVSTIIKAPREVVYRAFLEPDAVASWLSPDNMRGHVEIFEPHASGKFRMSLTYLGQKDRPRGKTSEDTDTSEGTFVELIPNEKIVEVVEFESDQPDMAGEMKITWSLADADGGTEDNELGSRQSLRKLATYVERGTERDRYRDNDIHRK